MLFSEDPMHKAADVRWHDGGPACLASGLSRAGGSEPCRLDESLTCRPSWVDYVGIRAFRVPL